MCICVYFCRTLNSSYITHFYTPQVIHFQIKINKTVSVTKFNLMYKIIHLKMLATHDNKIFINQYKKTLTHTHTLTIYRYIITTCV